MGPKRAYGSREGTSLYTEPDLDRGISMKFHPLCGIELWRLGYDFESRQFSFTFHFGGWCMEGRRVTYDRISGGISWRVGEPYPPHWKFHPLTGKPLERRRTMVEVAIYTSDQIDAGQFGMTFHPTTGESLTLLMYDPEERKFYKWVCGGTGWGMKSCVPRRQYLPRIGDGRPRRAGKLFTHMHWKFDPFTGQSLEPRRGSGGLWEQE